MPLNFPADPADNASVTFSGVTYIWDATRGTWDIETPLVDNFVDADYVGVLIEEANKRITRNTDLIEGLGQITAQGTYTFADTVDIDNVYASAVQLAMSGGADSSNAVSQEAAIESEKYLWMQQAMLQDFAEGQVGVATYTRNFDDVVCLKINNTDATGKVLKLEDPEILLIGGEVEIYLFNDDVGFGTNIDFYCIASIEKVEVSDVVDSADDYGITLRPIHGVGSFDGFTPGTTSIHVVFHTGVSVATGSDLAKYLPLTGGNVTGTLEVSGKFEHHGLAENSPSFVLSGGAADENDANPHTKNILELNSESQWNSYVGYYGSTANPDSLVVRKDLDFAEGLTIGGPTVSLKSNETALSIDYREFTQTGTAHPINITRKMKAAGELAETEDEKVIFRVTASGDVLCGRLPSDHSDGAWTDKRKLISVEWFEANASSVIKTNMDDAPPGSFVYHEGALFFRPPA